MPGTQLGVLGERGMGSRVRVLRGWAGPHAMLIFPPTIWQAGIDLG